MAGGRHGQDTVYLAADGADAIPRRGEGGGGRMAGLCGCPWAGWGPSGRSLCYTSVDFAILPRCAAAAGEAGRGLLELRFSQVDFPQVDWIALFARSMPWRWPILTPRLQN